MKLLLALFSIEIIFYRLTNISRFDIRRDKTKEKKMKKILIWTAKSMYTQIATFPIENKSFVVFVNVKFDSLGPSWLSTIIFLLLWQPERRSALEQESFEDQNV